MTEKLTKIDFRTDCLHDHGNSDRLFTVPRRAFDFNFGEETARVFDDMVSRSVPFYGEIQRMVCEIASSFAVSNTNIYDIGCATGTTLKSLDTIIDPGVHLIGIDNSDDMLAKAEEKLKRSDKNRDIRFINADLNYPVQFNNSSAVIMLLTLQFVRPLKRKRLVKDIHKGLRDDGCLILVEKVTGTSTLLNRLFIEYYYNYKRRMGYSDMEIAQKRESLENILIPYHHEENRNLMLEAGFRYVDEFFRWYNFSGLVAVK
jgi:tRNA (cmo5U34)-methyltransferase